MCEATAYVMRSDSEEMIMESVATIKPIEENKYELRGLFGDRLELEGELIEINLMKNRIIFNPKN